MRATTIAIAFCLALGFMALPLAVPAIEPISPVGDAQAAQCVIGSSSDCIVQIVCVREPCP